MFPSSLPGPLSCKGRRRSATDALPRLASAGTASPIPTCSRFAAGEACVRRATASGQSPIPFGRFRNDTLFALAHAYWQFARDKPGLYAASLRAAKPGEKDVAAAGEALIGTVLAVLAGYGMNGDDALHATRGLRAVIHGFVSLDAAGGFRLKLNLSESFDRLLGAFARDLAAPGR